MSGLFKFRAFENGKMHYQVRCGGVFEDIPTAPTVWNEDAGDWLNLTGQPHTVVMQYTGLKDRHGKEIYEGDIIECLHEGNGFVTKRHGAYGIKTRFGFYPFIEIYGEAEVIGNIYENSESLSR